MYSYMSTLKKLIFLKKAAMRQGVEHVVHGIIVSFITRKARKSKSLKVALEPIQSGSGTPSPDNVRPISGWDEVNTHRTGKNLAEMISDGMTPSISSGLLVSYPQSTHSQYIKVNPSEAYTASFGNTLLNAVFQYDADKKFIRVDLLSTALKTVTTASTTAYIILRCDRDRNTDPISNCQLELGSTATEYEPYQGETYTTDLGQTVYGGTLDVVSGELVIDRAYVEFDGSNDEAWEKYGSGSASTYAMSITVPNLLRDPTRVTCRANYLTPIIGNSTWGNYDGFISVGAKSSGSIATGIQSITTVDDWKSFLASNPLQVVYELANPTTIQLTPQEVQTLLGVNNVWADAGAVEVTYVD